MGKLLVSSTDFELSCSWLEFDFEVNSIDFSTQH